MHLLEPSTLAWVDADYIIIDFPYDAKRLRVCFSISTTIIFIGKGNIINLRGKVLFCDFHIGKFRRKIRHFIHNFTLFFSYFISSRILCTFFCARLPLCTVCVCVCDLMPAGVYPHKQTPHRETRQGLTTTKKYTQNV